MTFDAETIYTELRTHFRERVRRNEPLARHCTFGVGGPADVWVSLETRDELHGLVTLCIEQHWPLLLVGNGTNTLYADAGMRGIVARIALNSYTIEEKGDGTALLLAEGGISWPRLLNELAPPKVNVPWFSRKKSRFSGKNRLKRVRLTCCWSASTCAKSVL